MDLLPIFDVQPEGWNKLISDWGGGEAQPRYIYPRDCTSTNFPGHKVLRGPHPAGGTTDSGFLVNATGDVVGGVDAINSRVIDRGLSTGHRRRSN